MNTPVVLTLFNNPEAVRHVFATIRVARPPKLFLISDAGRTPEEQILVQQSRSIAEAVDWNCEVYKKYSDINIGAKECVSEGISWVFEQVDRAIILEHDCLPDISFFRYCEELLEKYKDDTRVMHISGNNFHQEDTRFVCPDSYYFSLIPLIWGFATWKRAWDHYDVTLKQWPEIQKSGLLKSIFKDPAVLDRWEYLFAQYYRGTVNSWDGQWTFACLIHHGLSINPSHNLVSNIGFGEQALNTRDAQNELAALPVITIQFPLSHPKEIAPDAVADAYIFMYIFKVRRTHKDKLCWLIKEKVPGFYQILKRIKRLFWKAQIIQ